MRLIHKRVNKQWMAHHTEEAKEGRDPYLDVAALKPQQQQPPQCLKNAIKIAVEEFLLSYNSIAVPSFPEQEVEMW